MQPGQRIFVEVSEVELQSKFFRSRAILQLPTRPTYNVFAARMARAQGESATHAQKLNKISSSHKPMNKQWWPQCVEKSGQVAVTDVLVVS